MSEFIRSIVDIWNYLFRPMKRHLGTTIKLVKDDRHPEWPGNLPITIEKVVLTGGALVGFDGTAWIVYGTSEDGQHFLAMPNLYQRRGRMPTTTVAYWPIEFYMEASTQRYDFHREAGLTYYPDDVNLSALNNSPDAWHLQPTRV